MLYFSPHLQKEAEELAEKLGTHIPGHIDMIAWPLPILQAMQKKIEELEGRIRDLSPPR